MKSSEKLWGTGSARSPWGVRRAGRRDGTMGRDATELLRRQPLLVRPRPDDAGGEDAALGQRRPVPADRAGPVALLPAHRILRPHSGGRPHPAVGLAAGHLHVPARRDGARAPQHAGAVDVRRAARADLGFALLPALLLRHRHRCGIVHHRRVAAAVLLRRPDLRGRHDRRLRSDLRAADGVRHVLPRDADPDVLPVPGSRQVLRDDHRRRRVPVGTPRRRGRSHRASRGTGRRLPVPAPRARDVDRKTRGPPHRIRTAGRHRRHQVPLRQVEDGAAPEALRRPSGSGRPRLERLPAR